MLGLDFDTGQHAALGHQLLFKHSPGIIACFGHDRGLYFGAGTFFHVRLQQGLHLGANLGLDFLLELMAQITLRRFEFLLLALGGGFRLHARFGQRTRLGFGARTCLRQRLRLGFGCGTRRGQCLLLLFGLFRLFARQRGMSRIGGGGIALRFFLGNFCVQRESCGFRGRLRASGLFQRTLLGIASCFGFNVKARTQLCFTFGARARFGLCLFARQCERCHKLRVNGGGGSGAMRGGGCARALNLTGRRRRTVLRRFERGRCRWIESSFLGRSKVKVVVDTAKIGERLFFLDFEYFDVTVLLKR